MKRILSLGIVFVLIFGLVSMTGCEKKKLSEMELDQCKKHLIRCGLELPEEYEDINFMGYVVEIEQFGSVYSLSWEPWDNCFNDFKKAVEKYYGRPMPLEPLPGMSTESSERT